MLHVGIWLFTANMFMKVLSHPDLVTTNSTLRGTGLKKADLEDIPVLIQADLSVKFPVISILTTSEK